MALSVLDIPRVGRAAKDSFSLRGYIERPPTILGPQASDLFTRYTVQPLMALNTFSKLLSLAAVVAVANAEYWIFGGSRPIVTTRLDPILFPNTVNTTH